jgi:hypothetical protein
MKTVQARASYYRQFDAEPHRDVPAEGFGGWTTAEIPLALDHTALVIMHAWDCGTPAMYPGWHRVGEFIPRSQAICGRVFPKLLAVVRASPLRLFHVVSGTGYYEQLPGYKRALQLAGPSPGIPEQIQPDPVWGQLQQFRAEHIYGTHNRVDIEHGFKNLDFAPEARPVAAEGVAADGHQLFALCREASVNHLVYAGFAINECLHQSPGGMLDMHHRGFLCSALRQAVTAVENKETARQELAKELGLWRVARSFGFVFEVEDFVAALPP